MPFIVMCYQHGNEKHWYECDFPCQFLKEWEDKNLEEYEVKYIIVAGQWLGGCRNLESIVKALKG